MFQNAVDFLTFVKKYLIWNPKPDYVNMFYNPNLYKQRDPRPQIEFYFNEKHIH